MPVTVSRTALSPKLLICPLLVMPPLKAVAIAVFSIFRLDPELTFTDCALFNILLLMLNAVIVFEPLAEMSNPTPFSAINELSIVAKP